jgi:hypothetical protein
MNMQLAKRRQEGEYDLYLIGEDEPILINQKQKNVIIQAKNDTFLQVNEKSFFKHSIHKIEPHYETYLLPEKTYHWYSGDTYYCERCDKFIHGGEQKAIEHKCK